MCHILWMMNEMIRMRFINAFHLFFFFFLSQYQWKQKKRKVLHRLFDTSSKQMNWSTWMFIRGVTSFSLWSSSFQKTNSLSDEQVRCNKTSPIVLRFFFLLIRSISSNKWAKQLDKNITFDDARLTNIVSNRTDEFVLLDWLKPIRIEKSTCWITFLSSNH